MANNYTITGNAGTYVGANGELTGVYQQTETVGDIVISGNIANWTPDGVNDSTVLTIIPNQDEDGSYVTSASYFSVSNMSDLTDRVASVTFTDSGTANTLQNTVLVKVYLQPTFEMTGVSGNDTITLDIDGRTILWEGSGMLTNVEIVNEAGPTDRDPGAVTTPNANATIVVTPNTGFTRDTVTSGDNTTYDISGEATANRSENVGTLTVTAASDYYFQRRPYLAYINMPSNILRLSTTSITRDSSERITAYAFKIMYKNNVATKAKSGSKVFLKYEPTKIPATTTEIKNVIYGSSTISSLGSIRPIKVLGDVDAEFDLTVTKASDGSSIITRGSNADVFDSTVGMIKGINKKLTSRGRKSNIAKFTLNQEFPSTIALTTLANTARSSDAYVIVDSGASALKVGDRVFAKGIPINTVVKIAAGGLTSDVRVELDTSITIADNAVVSFARAETYYINIYPKTGTTLKSNIPTAVPHYTIYQYLNPVLKLTASAGTDYTLTTYSAIAYQGRAGSHVNQLKHLSSAKIPTTFSITWVATSSAPSTKTFTTHDHPTFSSTSSTASDWTNSVSADNNGMQLQMSNLKTSLNTSGTASTIATITMDVTIKKWGTADTTMNLDTSQFLACTT